MQRSDFDIDSLAAFLHITPAQVTKMVERGRLPGRKVGGKWRFSAAEIHHWLEERIGASDDEDLVAVERILDRGGDEATEISLAEVLTTATIAVPLSARTRSSVITSMCQLAAQSGWLWDPQQMADAVKARESLHPTALDNGVALLHPRRPQIAILAQAVVALGITSHGLPFGGPVPTDLFFLLAATSDAEHLRLLARVSRIIGMPEVLPRLRGATSADEALEVLLSADASIRDGNIP